MSNLSSYAQVQALTHIFRTGTWAKPTGLTIHLYTTTPAKDGTGGVEVAAASYAAVARNPLDANWSVPQVAALGANSTTDNVAVIQFPVPAENWGTIVGVAIKDQLANFIMIGNLVTPQTVNSGDAGPKFNIGGLDIIWL